MPPDQISLVDVYTELIRLSERVAAARLSDNDHETRLRALERWRYALPVSTLLAVGSTAAAVIALYH